MSFRAFMRQLGFQSGVQLNQLRDTTDGVVPDNSDQVVAALARLTRGPIDKPFRVNRGNFIARTGPAESTRVNLLNETKLQVYDALNNGSSEAVIQRLVPAAATKSFATLNFSGTPSGSANTVAFGTATTAPTTGFSIYLMHHDCHNDGIRVALHADATPLTGIAVAATDVVLRVMDVNGTVLHEFAGSLNPLAIDDFGKSRYLPDVADERSGGAVQIWVAANASVPTTSNAYGRAASQKDSWAISDPLVCFNEGGTTYTDTDFDKCITALRDTKHGYGYLITGGTKNVSLIGKLCALAIETNTPIKLDYDGNMTPSQVIAFDATLNLDHHLIHKNWAPLKASDPMNGGAVVRGSGGMQAGFSCARNARIDAKGFAPKQYPIAGRKWPLNWVGVTQLYELTDNERSDLARAQINPVIFETYNGGGLYVWVDSLTAAKTQVSYRKLQSVAERSVTLDTWVALASKEWLQSPMEEFIRDMTAFMEKLLQGADAAKWLKPANALGGASFYFVIKPSEVSPADTVHIEYAPSFDGTVRKVILQQTLVS